MLCSFKGIGFEKAVKVMNQFKKPMELFNTILTNSDDERFSSINQSI